jgi:hypothetical protein
MRDEMSKFGAAFLTASMLAMTPLAAVAAPAADTPQKISRDAAWGCRDKHDVFDLLFLGLSTSFDDRLADALADGRCVYFKMGEDVTIIEQSTSHGLVKVQRGGTQPATYWILQRNLN